jgi:hypothetical protein
MLETIPAGAPPAHALFTPKLLAGLVIAETAGLESSQTSVQ